MIILLMVQSIKYENKIITFSIFERNSQVIKKIFTYVLLIYAFLVI